MPDAGSPDFATFTDGTSLPRVGCKVSIQAQVLKDEPMPWFRVIARRIPDHWGEPKSIPGVNVFFSLSDRERGTVLRTLRRVRIHITDPRPYYEGYTSALQRVLKPGSSVQDFLARLDRQPNMQRIQEVIRRAITKHIVDDSPAERLKGRNELLECLYGYRIPSWIEIPPELLGMISPRQRRPTFDISAFEKQASSMVNQAATAVAKSASVFSEALDMVSDDGAALPAYSRAFAAMSIMKSVGASRAFDKGEPDSLNFVREQQKEVMAELRFPANMFPLKDLVEVDSVDHREIQAADIAAGIARECWYREGLVSVVRHFDYVLLNGIRLSETTAGSYAYFYPPLPKR